MLDKDLLNSETESNLQHFSYLLILIYLKNIKKNKLRHMK